MTGIASARFGDKFQLDLRLAASAFSLNRGPGSMEHWEAQHKVAQAA